MQEDRIVTNVDQYYTEHVWSDVQDSASIRKRANPRVLLYPNGISKSRRHGRALVGVQRGCYVPVLA
jgi:hypothetical protein